jgi:hypothetical protein
MEPLPLISLTFRHTPNHPKPPRAATDCQSFVSRLSPFDEDDLFVGECVGRITQCGADVLAREVRVRVEETCIGHALAQFAKDEFDGNPCSTYDRLPKHHTWIDFDTIGHSHTVARNIRAVRSRDLNERLTSFQRCDNCAEVGFDAAQQFRPPRVSDPNPDDGRTFLQNPTNCEVLIFGHDHRLDLRCVAANRFVGRGREATIEDMLGRVAERFNAPRQRRWQLSIDEKAQSCAPQDGVIVLAGGEFQYCRDVFRFEVRVIGKDLFAGRARGQKVEHVLHSDAKSPDARATTAHARIHRDSVYRAHVLSAGRPAPNRAILALHQALSLKIHPAVTELVPPGAWPANPAHGEGANV